MRLITHTCSNTEIVAALGRADWIVGTDDHSDFPPEVVQRAARVGPDLDIDIQRVTELKPDLVITSLTVPGHERCLEKLQAAGLPCLVTQPHTLSDVIRDIRTIGEAIDAQHAAEKLASRFEQTLNQPPPDGEPIPILIEWWPKPVIVPGQKSWVNAMLRLAGAFNPFENHEAESLEITADQARQAAPEAVVMSWCGVQESKYRPHIVTRRDGWDTIPALVNGQVVGISEAWLGRPGPRLIEGIDRLRQLVERVKAHNPRREC